MQDLLKNGFGFGGVLARTLPSSATDDLWIPGSVSTPQEKWMSLALLEAMNGIGWASPNPAVGCVIVKDDKIIARGFTQQFGGAHAERMAFESLGKNHALDSLNGLSVYVTLEPCTHVGKQPPCVDLLLHPSVKKVIIGVEDPDPRVSGRGIQQLKAAGKDVVIGVLANEIRAWHFPFLRSRSHQEPLWVAKWAENQDGLLADANGNSKWITNTMSRAYTHWLRQKYDAILVGAATWLRDRPQLTVRDCAEPRRRNPIVLIHDPKNKLAESPRPVGAWVFNEKNTADFIRAVHKTDFGFELQSIFCEGGARTLNELFLADRIDLVHRFVGQMQLEKPASPTAHRITAFQPGASRALWRRATTARFANDDLQEWVKWS